MERATLSFPNGYGDEYDIIAVSFPGDWTATQIFQAVDWIRNGRQSAGKPSCYRDSAKYEYNKRGEIVAESISF